MLKKTYCYEYQSYWCHYGARPSVNEYDTLEEAKHWQAVNMRVNDDAIIGPIFIKKTVIITKEELAKRAQRQALKATPKDKEQWNGVYTYWDGTREIVFYDDCSDKIYFKDRGTWAYMRDYLASGETLKVFDRKTNKRIATYVSYRNPAMELIFGDLFGLKEYGSFEKAN